MLRRTFSFAAVPVALSAGLAAGPLLMSPAKTLDASLQILSGGSSTVAGATVFSGPGMSNQFGPNFPGPGLGEQATQIRLPPGKLGMLRVNVTTENAPTSGKLNVAVRVNGATTPLNCSVAGTGDCTSTKSVALATESRVTIRVANSFVGSGFIAYTYSMVYD
jgi:hypothetical protein